MKSLLLTCMLISISGSSYGDSTDNIKNKLLSVLTPIQEMLKEDPSGERIQASFSKSRISNSIINYFYEVAGPLDEFSQAREERVKQVEQWLSPHEGALIAFLNAGEVGDPPHPSANMSLLQFADPTEKLRDALLGVGRNPDGRAQFTAEAYDTIFKLGLETPEIMQEVIQKIALRDNDPRCQTSDQTNLGTELLANAANWGRPELMEIYRKFLSVPYREEYYSTRVDKMKLLNNYRIAFTGLKSFGKLDGPLVAMIKERLIEIELSGTDNDRIAIAVADNSIDIAEGRIRPKPLTNLKGQFLGISKQTIPRILPAKSKDFALVKKDFRQRPSSSSSPLILRGQTTVNSFVASLNSKKKNSIIVTTSFILIGLVGVSFLAKYWRQEKPPTQD